MTTAVLLALLGALSGSCRILPTPWPWALSPAVRRAFARRLRGRRSFFSSILRAQQPAPVSESVVVTATSAPEEEKEIGVGRHRHHARGDREERHDVSVLELLRSVPGLDVVQSGTPGSLTSVFTRGTNSTQTLVLVDGVRMNSPYFPGYDFSALTTENVERIEIVRGPFSALYGSDAIGGVVQIFTRTPPQGFSGPCDRRGGQRGPGTGLRLRLGGRGPVSGDRQLPLRGVRRRPPELRLAGAQRLGAASKRSCPGGGRVAVEGVDPGRRGRQPGPGRRPSTGPRVLSRGAPRASRQLRALGREPPGRPRRRTCARSPTIATPTADSPRETDAADSAGARLGHGAARRALADGVRCPGSAGRWTTRATSARTSTGSARRSGASGRRTRRPSAPVTVTAGAALRLATRPSATRWSPRGTDRLALSRRALEGAGLGRRRASARRRSASSTTPSSGIPDLKPERSVSWEARRRALRRRRPRRGLALLERPEGPDRLRLRVSRRTSTSAARARGASRSAGGSRSFCRRSPPTRRTPISTRRTASPTPPLIRRPAPPRRARAWTGSPSDRLRSCRASSTSGPGPTAIR